MSHSPIPVLGISRSHRFSPNSTGRDEAIFMAVASRMERKGFDVSIISEDLFVAVDLEEFQLVFSMARSMDVLKALAEAERNGILKVVNSAECLLANTRDVIAKRFAQNDVPQPITIALDTSTTTSSSILSSLHLPLWLKRADACAQSPLDVQFIDSHEALEKGLVHFRENNIDRIVAVEHAEGDLVKFYGVEGSPFFRSDYPTAGNGFSKFGLEVHNGEAQHFPFSADQLKQLADRAARATGMTIYGGDAIIRSDGSIQLIDFNDWPSFSVCRKEAARAIAQRLAEECND